MGPKFSISCWSWNQLKVAAGLETAEQDRLKLEPDRMNWGGFTGAMVTASGPSVVHDTRTERQVPDVTCQLKFNTSCVGDATRRETSEGRALLTVDGEVEGGARLFLQWVNSCAIDGSDQVCPENPCDGQRAERLLLWSKQRTYVTL